MILVRDVFRLQFGRAREALAALREGLEIEAAGGAPVGRVLVDMTGDYYTLVLESEYRSLGDFERLSQQGMSSPAWRAWYAKFTPLVREGRREIFRVVEPEMLEPPKQAVGAVIAG